MLGNPTRRPPPTKIILLGGGENHAFNEIIGNPQAPYISSIATSGALLTNYHAITHPSQPNYFALYAGSTFGADNSIHFEPDPTLATILQGNGKTFIGYIESGSPHRHNPWESFPEGLSVERNFIDFPSSDFSLLPNVAFVVPSLDDDMHDGTIKQADQWLQSNIDSYAHWATTHNSLLVVVWDEDSNSGPSNQVPAILYGAHINSGTFSDHYTHYDLLSTLLDAFHLSGPNNAASASDIGNGVFLTSLDSGSYTDFGGDHRADVFLHNQNGTVALWQMNGGQVLSAAIIGSVGTEWDVQSTADFNGDGRGDVLWRATDGKVMVWTMNGPQIQNAQIVGAVGNEWHMQGTGDLDGDGIADLVWRNDAGTLMLWKMNGVQIQSVQFFGQVGNEWHVVGIGDFNGDGKSDILWRGNNGAVLDFQMNGTQIQSAQTVGSLGLEWHVAGVGDFNGDGKSDILWRNDAGLLLDFQMNGAQIQAAASPGVRTNDWHVYGTGDFDGDGKADILWRNDNGNVEEWQMNGSQVAATASITPLGTDWALGVHHYDLV